MNIGVSGYRNYNDAEYFNQMFEQHLVSGCHIHVGDATGVDTMCQAYCQKYNIPHTVYRADWSLGRRAGPIRNAEIIKNSDILLAFPHELSKGTKNAITLAKKKNIPVLYPLMDKPLSDAK